MKKVRIAYDVEEELVTRFRARLALDDIRAQQFINAAFRSYGEGTLQVVRGELISTKSLNTVSVSEAPQPTAKSPGRPKKEKQELSDEELARENSKKPWHEQDHSKRKLLEWVHPLMPVERDDAPSLTLETEDGKGRKFRDYIEDEWLEYRLMIASPEDWFDISMWMILEGAECKFRDLNNLNFRVRKDEIAAEYIQFNEEMTLKYWDEIDAKFPEVKTEEPK
jgi:hypothetical protein